MNTLPTFFVDFTKYAFVFAHFDATVFALLLKCNKALRAHFQQNHFWVPSWTPFVDKNPDVVFLNDHLWARFHAMYYLQRSTRDINYSRLCLEMLFSNNIVIERDHSSFVYSSYAPLVEHVQFVDWGQPSFDCDASLILDDGVFVNYLNRPFTIAQSYLEGNYLFRILSNEENLLTRGFIIKNQYSFLTNCSQCKLDGLCVLIDKIEDTYCINCIDSKFHHEDYLFTYISDHLFEMTDTMNREYAYYEMIYQKERE
jgi:hypothetical protein